MHFHGVSLVVGNRSLTASADVDNETVKLPLVDAHRFVQVVVGGLIFPRRMPSHFMLA